jgi:hypothetical protein
MAKSAAEIASELAGTIATLGQRLDAIESTIGELGQRHGTTAVEVTEATKQCAVIKEKIEAINKWKDEIGSLNDMKVQLAVVRRDVDELRKSKDAVVQRIWNIIGPLAGAAGGFALTYYFGKHP